MYDAQCPPEGRAQDAAQRTQDATAMTMTDTASDPKGSMQTLWPASPRPILSRPRSRSGKRKSEKGILPSEWSGTEAAAAQTRHRGPGAAPKARIGDLPGVALALTAMARWAAGISGEKTNNLTSRYYLLHYCAWRLAQQSANIKCGSLVAAPATEPST